MNCRRSWSVTDSIASGRYPSRDELAALAGIQNNAPGGRNHRGTKSGNEFLLRRG